MIQMLHFPVMSKSPMSDEFADRQRAALDDLALLLAIGFQVAGSSQVDSSDASYLVMVLSKPARPASNKTAPVITAHCL